MDQKTTVDRRHVDVPYCKTANGVAYRVFGDGPPLILLHGGAGNWHHWVMNVDALATRFRVLAVDLPSYGDSSAVPWETETSAYLDHVHAAVENMTKGAQAVHLAGFSFGGYIASDMAVRLGARTAALSMTGGAGYGKPVDRPFALGSRKKLTQTLGRDPTTAELRAMHAENLGKLMLWDKRLIDDWTTDMQLRNVEATRFDSRRLSWADATPTNVGRLSCPVMVVYGAHDGAFTQPIEERFALCRAAKADVQTHIIPDCGHWAMYEKPDAVNRLMLDFHRVTP